MHESCRPHAAVAEAAAAPVAVGKLRIGVALGSGSHHGVAHIGVIQELEARGLPVHVVAGTSVGAIIGALWASGRSGKQIEALGGPDDWDGIGSFAGSWQGLFSNRGLRAHLDKHLGGRPIESWPRRFGAVATHFASGERRILDRGDGAAAAQASSAIPVIFMPVELGSERLVDGALVEPVPAGAARALGADFVIAVDVAYRPYEEEARGLTSFAFQALHVLVNSLAAAQLREADIAIRMDLHERFMKCGHPALIDAGREAVRAVWPQLTRALQARSAR